MDVVGPKTYSPIELVTVYYVVKFLMVSKFIMFFVLCTSSDDAFLFLVTYFLGIE